MKILKYLILLIIIMLGALCAYVYTIDLNDIKNQVTNYISEQTGREVRVDGDIKIIPSLTPAVALSQVSLANANWGSKPKMLTVGRLEVKMNLIPLLQGNISIKKLVLNNAEILLETGKNGQPNWVLTHDEPIPIPQETARNLIDEHSEITLSQESQIQSPSSSLGFDFNEVLIKDAVVTYKDGVNEKQNQLNLKTIEIYSKGIDEPFNLSVNAEFNRVPVKIDATMGSINKLLANQQTPIKLSGVVDKATLQLEGHIDKPLQTTGLNIPFQFSVDKLSSLNQITSLELPEQGPIKIKGTLKDINGGYSIQSINATLLSYELEGDVSIKTTGQRPYLKTNLIADMLDISSLSKSNTQATSKSEKVFNALPLPLEVLKQIDFDISFIANQLITSSFELEQVKLNMGLENGTLKINPLQGNTAGGMLHTLLTLKTVDAETANLNLDLELSGIELGLLPQIQEYDLVQGGKTDATIKLQGAGGSIAQIAASLNGSIQWTTGKGKLSNTTVNLAGADLIYTTLNAINPLAKKEDYTQMECGVITFKINDGIAQSEQGIALQTSRMNVLGSGVINLKTEELDMGIRPNARDGFGAGLGKLVSMVRLGGTLAAPSPKIDKEAALKTGATVGAAIATGGLSMLAEGLLDKASSDENPCDIALGNVKKTAASSQKSKTEEKTIKETAKEKTQQATDKVKGLLKGLF